MRKRRRIIPGTPYLITKKCCDDLFWIVPSKIVNQVLLYALFLKAARDGIVIHAFCFMSNHLHLVVTDVRGTLPAFMRDFLSSSSKALQLALNSRGRIWSGERYSLVNLLDCDAAERKIAYTVLNPPRAHLVENPREWPGLNSWKWKLGKPLTVGRPDVYFSPRYSPDEVSITLEPVCLSYDKNSDPDASAARIESMIEQQVAIIRKEMRSRGEVFAGEQQVLGTSRERRGSHPVRTRTPRFATKNPELMADAIQKDEVFQRQHADAKEKYMAGNTKARFPAGTYGYHVQLGVLVATAA